MLKRRAKNQLDLIADPPPDLMRPLREYVAKGFRRIAGVDEAGRGPLAGPVVAAAVILPADFDPRTLAGVNDSKTLRESVRESLFDRILAEAEETAVGVVAPARIDEINILAASLEAMRTAIDALSAPPGLALVDGNQRIPDLPIPQRTLVKGDARCFSIAAASILAKVTRDRMMVEADTAYPGYGFARHKGYGTAQHRDALRRLGPCPLHRRSFAPVRDQPTRPTVSQERGVRFEEVAARSLRSKGFRIIARNFRCPVGEIDLVARDGEVLVFVEVRARADDRFGGALASVTATKQRKLIEAARTYLDAQGGIECAVRFDVVAIDASGKRNRIEHVRNAFGLDETTVA